MTLLLEARKRPENFDDAFALPLGQLVSIYVVALRIRAAHEQICSGEDLTLPSEDGAFLDEATEGRDAAASAYHDHRGVFDIVRGMEAITAGPDGDVDMVALLEIGEERGRNAEDVLFAARERFDTSRSGERSSSNTPAPCRWLAKGPHPTTSRSR